MAGAPACPARHVITAAVPEPPQATWSNCLVIGSEVVVSGITANPALNADGTVLDTRAQAERIMQRLQALLDAAGGKVANIYKLVIYLANVQDKGIVSDMRRQWFSFPYPCSTLIEVNGFAFDGLTIEIDAFARLDYDPAKALQQTVTTAASQ